MGRAAPRRAPRLPRLQEPLQALPHRPSSAPSAPTAAYLRAPTCPLQSRQAPCVLRRTRLSRLASSLCHRTLTSLLAPPTCTAAPTTALARDPSRSITTPCALPRAQPSLLAPSRAPKGHGLAAIANVARTSPCSRLLILVSARSSLLEPSTFPPAPPSARVHPPSRPSVSTRTSGAPVRAAICTRSPLAPSHPLILRQTHLCLPRAQL